MHEIIKAAFRPEIGSRKFAFKRQAISDGGGRMLAEKCEVALDGRGAQLCRRGEICVSLFTGANDFYI